MKYKITDLMDLYEDRNSSITSGSSPEDPVSGEGMNQIKASRHAFGWKQGLSLAAVLVLVVLGGFGLKQLLHQGGLQPGQTGAPGQSGASEQLPRDTNDVVWLGWEPVSGPEQEELSRFLTCFAQQGVESMEDLDTDAERIRFAFIYRRIYDPESIPVQRGGDGELWDTLSPEQVNETLTRLLGKTVTPAEGADYSLLRSEPAGGRCSFHDGYFWQEPSGEDHLLRFSLATDALNSRDGGRLEVMFTTYEVQLLYWGNGDLYPLPGLSTEEAEALAEEGKLKALGTCVAELLETGDGYRLLGLTPQSTEPEPTKPEPTEPGPEDTAEDPHTDPTGFDLVSAEDWERFNGLLTNAARCGFPKIDENGDLASTDVVFPNQFAQASALTDWYDDIYEARFEVYEADPERWPEFLSLNPARIEDLGDLIEAGKIRVVGSGAASFRRENGVILLKGYSCTPLVTKFDTGVLDLLRSVDTEWWTETGDGDGTRTVRALILYADGGLYYREGDPNSEFCLFIDGHWTVDESGSLVLQLWESPYTAWDRPDDYLVSAAAVPADSSSARFACERTGSVLSLTQQSESGLGEHDGVGTVLRFDAVFGSRAAVPEAGWQYEDERPESLEFWLTQPIYAWDVLDHARICGMYGGRLYLGKDYEPVPMEGGDGETWPEQCVTYECTAYPDYADGGLFVTRISITDPAVSVYGLSVEASAEDFDAVFRARGYEVTEDQNSNTPLRVAVKDGITVRFYSELDKLIFFVEVSNRDRILF